MTKMIEAIAAFIIVIFGAWYFFWSNPAQAPAPAATTTEQTPAVTETKTTSTTNTTTGITVTYGPQGFSPATLTVPVGTKVLFVNQNANPMWVASAPHPSHQGYDGTTKDVHCATGYTGPAPFDECAPGATGVTYSFTFTKAGTWKYHNHFSAGDFGTVVVTAPTPI